MPEALDFTQVESKQDDGTPTNDENAKIQESKDTEQVPSYYDEHPGELPPGVNSLLHDIYYNKNLYVLCQEYYEKRERWLSIPATAIQALSGFLAFVASSEYIVSQGDGVVGAFTIVVGFLASIGTLVNSIKNGLKFGTRAEVFGNAAQEYSYLLSKMAFTLRAKEELAWKEWEDRVLDIKKTMAYFPPEYMMRTWKPKLEDSDADTLSFVKSFKNHKVRSRPTTLRASKNRAAHDNQNSYMTATKEWRWDVP